MQPNAFNQSSVHRTPTTMRVASMRQETHLHFSEVAEWDERRAYRLRVAKRSEGGWWVVVSVFELLRCLTDPQTIE
jgi:hypothetical protein